MTKGIAVLGSTGSIGAQTLEVARFLGLRVHALAAGENVDLLFTQTREFLPEFVSVAFAPAADRLHARLNSDAGLLRALDGRTIEVGYGDAGLRKAAAGTDAETTVAAVSGAAGLPAVLAAIRAKKRVALANKESLVMAGRLVTSGAKERGVDLIPVDSEHCAIFQCLAGSARGDVRRLVLTASGGPFRDRPVAELAGITPEQAAAHPVWNMGKKISIDSATMMNKGLEVIEASWLFGVGRERIDVLIHPQSAVHSMVEFADRSVVAQLGAPDMRTPIQYALTYPEKREGLAAGLDLAALGQLTFSRPDFERFPGLRLAYDALAAGGTMPAVYNAANEAAVGLFLRGAIGFLDIPRLVAHTMERHSPSPDDDLAAILAADAWARTFCARPSGD